MYVNQKQNTNLQAHQSQSPEKKSEGNGAFSTMLADQFSSDQKKTTQQGQRRQITNDEFHKNLKMEYHWPEMANLESDEERLKFKIDKIYENKPDETAKKLGKLPLLLRGSEEISHIQAHVSQRMKELSEEYDIPQAPESITYKNPENTIYNNSEEMVLPETYAHSKQWHKMLDENPGLKRAIADLYGISQYHAQAKAREPLTEKLASAESVAEREAISAKYPEMAAEFIVDVSIRFDEHQNAQVFSDEDLLDLTARKRFSLG